MIMTMLGTHKPQQQSTLTKYMKISEIFLRFRFRTIQQREILHLDFLIVFVIVFVLSGNYFANKVPQDAVVK